MVSRSLLVVDDDRGLLQAMELVLSDTETEVRLCATVAEALSALARKVPDILILDLNLPDGDAFRVLDDLARYNPMPHVVAISGVATKEDTFRLGQLGVARFLSKPFDTDQLLLAISQVETHASVRSRWTQALGARSVHDLQEELRSSMVREALARSGGSVTRAASLLGVSRQVLQYMMRKYRVG